MTGWPLSESDDGGEGPGLDIRDGGRAGQTNQRDQGSYRAPCQTPRAVRGPGDSPAQGRETLSDVSLNGNVSFVIILIIHQKSQWSFFFMWIYLHFPPANKYHFLISYQYLAGDKNMMRFFYWTIYVYMNYKNQNSLKNSMNGDFWSI